MLQLQVQFFAVCVVMLQAAVHSGFLGFAQFARQGWCKVSRLS